MHLLLPLWHVGLGVRDSNSGTEGDPWHSGTSWVPVAVGSARTPEPLCPGTGSFTVSRGRPGLVPRLAREDKSAVGATGVRFQLGT